MNFNNTSKYKLGDICDKIGSGATPRGGKEAYYSVGEYSLVRSQNILDYFFSYDGLAFIDEDQATKLNNVTLIEDDVLLNITGDSVARVCQVPKQVLPARVNQHVVIIRPNKKILDNCYLKYYLLNPNFKNHLLNISKVGATRKAITKVMIEDLDVEIPSLNVQKKIAKILSDIDSKIELNKKNNLTLEKVAKTLYNKWFISYDFPEFDGNLINSELGDIPASWNVDFLSEMFDFLEGPGLRHWQYKDEGIPFINIRLINGNNINVKDANFVSEEDANGRYSHFLLKEKDIVLSTSGTIGKNAIVRSNHLPLMLNTSVIRLRPVDGFSYAFMYQFINSDYFISELKAYASGSVQLNFGPTHLKQIKFIIPSKSLLDKYNKIVSPIYERILKNFDEIEALEDLRNTLLPKLMKGEIEINNI